MILDLSGDRAMDGVKTKTSNLEEKKMETGKHARTILINHLNTLRCAQVAKNIFSPMTVVFGEKFYSLQAFAGLAYSSLFLGDIAESH